MKSRYVLFCGIAGVFFAGAGLFAADVASTNQTVTSPPVYVPDLSHANDPLPDGFLAWNSLTQTTNVAAGEPTAHFVFSFTNISETIDRTWTTNVTALAHVIATTNSGFWSFWRKRVSYVTNFTTVTNAAWVTNSITPIPVTILSAHASCGCTQPELPPLPWTIPTGSNGQFGATVNLGGMSGMLVKYITVSTDKGSKQLNMVINVLPTVIPTLSDAERARGMEVAKADRQAVFKADCATCHAKPAEGKYGQALYTAVCAVCHDAQNRATMVPNLHNLTVPTNEEFWRTWTAHGKAGTLMPAFSTAEGGPLNDTQIASVATYLNYAIPSHVVTLMTNAPPAK
jgi:mono/diheme cytochrome c family protein